MAEAGATRLAVVGASVRAAAQAALRAGHHVVAADLFADADLRRLCKATRVTGYPAALAAWLDAQDVDAWFYTGALENHPELVDRMAASRPLWGARGEPLRRSRDPLELQRVFHAHGVPFPETHAGDSPPCLTGAWLVKSTRGANGSAVWRFEDAPEDAARGPCVYQRHVPGRPASALFAIREAGATCLGTSLQLMGRHDVRRPWRCDGNLSPLPDPPAGLDAWLVRLGRALHGGLDERGRFGERGGLGLRGVVGVDFVLNGDEPWVVEVNPRWTASAEVVERASGLNPLAAAWGPPTAGGESVATFAAPGYVARGVLYAPAAVTVSAGFADWALASATGGPDALVADTPAAGERLVPGAPAVTVYASGADPDATLRTLQRNQEAVWRRLSKGC